MKYFRLTFLILLGISLMSKGQENTDFKELIGKLNLSLSNYSKINPYNFSEEYVSLHDFDLEKDEIEELKEQYSGYLNSTSDSIEPYILMETVQIKVVDHLDSLLAHPDFDEHEVEKMINSEDLDIIVSDDGKLYNFSLDEKTGGTYRSRISRMYYKGFSNQDSADYGGWFEGDGYYEIRNLEGVEKAKYVLSSSVRGCSYCFGTSVQVISFENNQFTQEFGFSTYNRDWNDGVYYDHDTKTITVDYKYDDLTSSCSCSKRYHSLEDFNFDGLFEYRCIGKYVYKNGKFKRIEGRLEMAYTPREDYPEVLSFQLIKNQKEIKLYHSSQLDLNYLFLDSNKMVEFSHPRDIPYESDFSLSPNKDTLSFYNGKTAYHIYEDHSKDQLTAIGIMVHYNGKTYNLKGDPMTLKGSLNAIDFSQFYNVLLKAENE